MPEPETHFGRRAEAICGDAFRNELQNLLFDRDLQVNRMLREAGRIETRDAHLFWADVAENLARLRLLRAENADQLRVIANVVPPTGDVLVHERRVAA